MTARDVGRPVQPWAPAQPWPPLDSLRGASAPPGVRILRRGEPDWPDALEHLDLPPPALWVRGTLPHAPAVAVVGARDATIAGLEVARRLGADLAVAGIPVISGMALGIDGAAHQGALDAGGLTVAVLGCGIEFDYPRAHRRLKERIADGHGALLTEEPPGTSPAPWRFPRRNRIIAALATAVVVVEATDRSGALSTARHALDLGREVFAVPGSVLSERSSGANRLVRDGATPLTETADLAAVPALLAAIEANRARFRLAGPPLRTARQPHAEPNLHPTAAAILRRLSHDPTHPDILSRELRVTPAELARHLADLELAGVLRTLPGGLVVRDAAAGPRAHTAATRHPDDPAVERASEVGKTPRQPSGGSGEPLLSSAAPRPAAAASARGES